ncbi:MAG TPA: hypothetical protein VMH04_03665 [Candidatus Solibacter sp.]|nr:hypothetical protein [Candidatus Solibacter sp.]
MKNLLSLCVALFVLAFASSAFGQTTNVCGETTVTPGGNFTWTSTYSVPIKVEPVTGETWFLGSVYVDIPANGSVTLPVPQNLPSGYNVDLQVAFDTRQGGNPCGNYPGMPHVGNPG